jgi:hypothetical protein
MGNFISWLEKNLPDPNQGDARGTQPQSLSGMSFKSIQGAVAEQS